jgi:hypothetical protein
LRGEDGLYLLRAELAIEQLDFVDGSLEILERLRPAIGAHTESQVGGIDDRAGAQGRIERVDELPVDVEPPAGRRAPVDGCGNMMPSAVVDRRTR